MPTVNTLVVDRADLLGLGQLHQLRGRVGRAGQRAYAYLFHPVDRVLSEQAYERLRTIGDHTELGSGLQDRPARPADPGGGQPAGARPVGPHRRHRLRPLRPDGVRGGVRAEGRAPAPAGRAVARPARRRPPARRLRGGRGRPARGLPPADGGADRGARSTTCGPSGRTGSARCRRRPRPCSTWPGCGSSACGSGDHRCGGAPLPGGGMAPGRSERAGPPSSCRPITLPASAEVRLRRLAPGRHLPGRPAPAVDADAGARPRGGVRPGAGALLAELVPAG